MKILLVDDLKSLLLYLESYLSDLGHQVVTCNNGHQAVVLFSRENPDLVIMDIEMPEMDGYQATRKIRLLQDHWVPIILLTGRGNDDDLAKGIESGGDDYLIKPVSPIVLNAKMAAMERIAAMRHELISSQKELAQVNALLKHQAKMDGLTGLINRLTFDTRLRREIQQARVNKAPLPLHRPIKPAFLTIHSSITRPLADK